MFHYVYNGCEWRDCDIEDGSESDRKRTTHGTLETTGKPGAAKTPGAWRQEDRPSSRRKRPAIMKTISTARAHMPDRGREDHLGMEEA